jgi:hypothetical protein
MLRIACIDRVTTPVAPSIRARSAAAWIPSAVILVVPRGHTGYFFEPGGPRKHESGIEALSFFDGTKLAQFLVIAHFPLFVFDVLLLTVCRFAGFRALVLLAREALFDVFFVLDLIWETFLDAIVFFIILAR